MDLISGTPFWRLRTPSGPLYRSLRTSVTCEVCVVGGGYSGALVAHVLADAGLDVVVVDRRTFGAGSTLASTALIEYQLDADLHEFIALAGRESAVRCYRLSRDAVGKLEGIVRRLDDTCDWQRKDGLHLASSPKAVGAIRREYKARTRYGFDVELVTRRELRDRYGVAGPAALFYPDAAQVDPLRLTHALIRNARSGCVRAFTRTEVVAVERSRATTILRTRGRAEIHAGRVVFATGYEALRDLPKGLAKLVNTYALVSQPLQGWPRGIEECVFTETMDPYLYARTTVDGRIMMGGEDDAHGGPALRARRLPAKTRALLRKFRRWFPDLRVTATRSWAGAFAATADGLGFVDETYAMPGTYFVVGAGGNGMIFSMLAAEILRDLCLGRRNPDRALFRFDRPGVRVRS